jgi:type VI secretion system secreted protein VgrG
LNDYQALAPYYADHDRELSAYARLRMQAEEMKAATFFGAGPPSDLPIASRFVLIDGPPHDGESSPTFITTSTHLELRNNLPEAMVATSAPEGDAAEDAFAASYGNYLQFTAVAAGVPLVPSYADLLDRPTVNGTQTATVVGPEGEEVFTDALGRIRIRFHWQEADLHPSDTPDASERSSTWVRVAWPGAGDGFGHQFLPRIGQEVLVTFLHGDIDRPVVVGALHNGRHAPPRFSGQHGLPGNHAISGIHSREHGGEAYSELLMDNTPDEVRVRLAASPFASELNLGHLNTPRVDGQAQPRGQGAELRTDAGMALRAAQGVLISSYARGLAQGDQLDRQELLALLDDCTELFQGLGETAAQRGASACDDEGMAQLVKDLRNWPEATTPGEGAAVVAVAAEGGLVSATPVSQLHYAGANHDVVATDDVQSTSGGHTRLVAGLGLSLYAQDEHLQLIANHGNVLLQAQSADLQARAENNLLLAAGEGEVVISAPRIRLVADDGSYLRLGGGIELGTDGTAVVHAARHDWLDAKTDSADTVAFARDPASRQLRFHYEGDPQAVAAGVQHTLSLDDGDTVQGMADADGLGESVQRDGMQRVRVQARQNIEDAQGGSDD